LMFFPRIFRSATEGSDDILFSFYKFIYEYSF
jgi:hypothetical protein